MAEVRVGSHESFEQALRRFNKLVQQTGILAEARRREHYFRCQIHHGMNGVVVAE